MNAAPARAAAARAAGRGSSSGSGGGGGSGGGSGAPLAVRGAPLARRPARALCAAPAAPGRGAPWPPHGRGLGAAPRAAAAAASPPPPPAAAAAAAGAAAPPAAAPRPTAALPKNFDPEEGEPRLYAFWEASGAFAPDVSAPKAPYTIAMPPPNVTGKLHMGHAMFVTLQDIMARYRWARALVCFARVFPLFLCVLCVVCFGVSLGGRLARVRATAPRHPRRAACRRAPRPPANPPRRMAGHPTLWLPGTDHAGIATQSVVEKQLEAAGSGRAALGREAFVQRVWDWKRE